LRRRWHDVFEDWLRGVVCLATDRSHVFRLWHRATTSTLPAEMKSPSMADLLAF
jgi:hypothetical protein